MAGYDTGRDFRILNNEDINKKEVNTSLLQFVFLQQTASFGRHEELLYVISTFAAWHMHTRQVKVYRFDVISHHVRSWTGQNWLVINQVTVRACVRACSGGFLCQPTVSQLL